VCKIAAAALNHSSEHLLMFYLFLLFAYTNLYNSGF
jgi:hypothetical protein